MPPISKRPTPKNKLPVGSVQRAIVKCWMEFTDKCKPKYRVQSNKLYGAIRRECPGITIDASDVRLSISLNDWNTLRATKQDFFKKKMSGDFAQYLWENREGIYMDKAMQPGKEEICMLAEIDPNDWSPIKDNSRITKSAVETQIAMADLDRKLIDNTTAVKVAKVAEEILEQMREHLGTLVKGSRVTFQGAVAAIMEQLIAHKSATRRAAIIKLELTKDTSELGGPVRVKELERQLRILERDMISAATLKQIASIATSVDMGKINLVLDTLGANKEAGSTFIYAWNMHMAPDATELPLPKMETQKSLPGVKKVIEAEE